MSVVNLDSRFLIRNLVPTVLGLIPQEERPSTGLFMTLDLRLHHWGAKTHKEFYDRSFCHLLFRAPWSVTGGINTFFYESEGFESPNSKFPWDKMENISNHDSCWVDAMESKLTQVYFRMARGIQERNDATINRKKVAPREMHQFNTMDNISRVNIKLEQIHDLRYGNDRYKIVSATDVKALNY